MYEADDDTRGQMEIDYTDYESELIDVKEPIMPIDDSQYDRSDYLQRLSSEYTGIALPGKAHGYYRYWNPNRPAKQENLFWYPPIPSVARLPVPGNPTEDRMRQFFKQPFHDNGDIKDSGEPVIGTSLGLMATPHQERYEAIREPRSMKEEVDARAETSKAPDAISGRWVALSPYYQGVLGGKPKDTAVQYRKRFLGDVKPIGKNLDGLDLGSPMWLTGGGPSAAYNPNPELAKYQTGNRLEQKPFMVSQVAFDNEERPTIVTRAFTDTTNRGQKPTIRAATVINERPRIGSIAYPRHKGFYEELNRCPNPDNTSFTGATYYFKRGPDSLQDTSYKSYTPGPGWTAPPRIDAQNAPITPQFQTHTRRCWDTLTVQGRERYNQDLAATATGPFQKNLGIANLLPENQLDTTAHNQWYYAPPIRWVENRKMVIPDYFEPPDEKPYGPRYQPPLPPSTSGPEVEWIDPSDEPGPLPGRPQSGVQGQHSGEEIEWEAPSFPDDEGED